MGGGSNMVAVNNAAELVHSYASVEEAMRLVREGKRSFYTQYLLNPSLHCSDISFTVSMLIFLCILRFIMAGAHHPRVRRIPCVFRSLFGRVSKPKRESKLCENLWYSCWHTFSFCFGLYVLFQEGLTAENPGWSRLLIRDFDLKWYWFPTPAERELGNPGWPLFPVSPVVKLYYLTELAFWLSCAVYLSLETIRDDFHALMLHHTVTCLLIFFSYTCSFWRIGTIILVTHDIADIILYSAKAIHYTYCPDKLVDFLFVLFVAGFFISRLVFFPLFCVRPALDSSSLESWVKGIVKSHWQVPGGITLPCALCVLQMLHIFWFGLIIKMIIRTWKGKLVSEAGDIRSDDEDDNVEVSQQGKDDDSSVAESSSDSNEEADQRMKLSSLPGVRATLTRKELRSPRRHQRPSNEESSLRQRLRPKEGHRTES